MKLVKTVVAAVALTWAALGPVGATAVTNNPARDNPEGTVEIIDVAATPSTAVCSNPTGACTITTSVVLDPWDPRPGAYLANARIDLYLLNGSAPADLNATDCSRSTDLLVSTAAAQRTLLGTVLSTGTTRSTFTVSVNMAIPFGKWTYGLNWLCATSAPLGGTGGIGDQAFSITR